MPHLNQVGSLTDGIQRQNGKVGKSAQAEGQGNAAHPDEAAVKQEGHHGLTAGAKGKISGVGVGLEGHTHGADADQPACQLSDFLRGVVNVGKNDGEGGHQSTENDTGADRQDNKLAVAVANLGFGAACAQHLTHENSHSIAHG